MHRSRLLCERVVFHMKRIVQKNTHRANQNPKYDYYLCGICLFFKTKNAHNEWPSASNYIGADGLVVGVRIGSEDPTGD
ncbi:hypothetical protein FRX31_004096 [Thalictrum thalictroides]|uniref:Uncharacterized protein n=1 Tax=Thalictrum thalictroides TaxID=46969 RepID=A0A7J6X9A2_THATH|nr:hypothetical protein FRX31_004096 [Thalictrum thalictroides]